MPLGLRAIIPKRLAVIDGRQVSRDVPIVLNAYAQRLRARLQKYPAQLPTVSGYRRTGDLGRGWSAPGSLTIRGAEMILVNRTAHAVYVQGPRPGGRRPGTRQAAEMRRRGWPNVSDVAREERKQFPVVANRAIRGRPGVG